MNLADVMDQVGERADTIAGLRVFRYPPPKLTPPGAWVDYPDTVEFDQTYGRGLDRMTLPFVVVVGKVSDRAAQNQLGAYCDGDGEKSIKAVLESGSYTAFDELHVRKIEFDPMTVAANVYMGALFTLDISGKGTS